MLYRGTEPPRVSWRLVGLSHAALSLIHWREFGDVQREPLGAVPVELDLGAGVFAVAFQAEHYALTEFVVKHGLTDAQAVRACS